MNFSFLQFDFMKNALIAIVIITPVLGLIGTMAVNNKMAFFSDALGHSALTGVALGVLSGINNYMLSMVLFGIIIALLIVKIKSAETISTDTVIGVFSSISIALGLVILSKDNNFRQYSSFLSGDILNITTDELKVVFAFMFLILIVWSLIFNKLLVFSINAQIARSKGINTGVLENVFVIIVAIVVMISVKWVGVLLINSLLILPAAAARNISDSAVKYISFSVIFSIISGIAGLITSYYINTSAGATIALYAAGIFIATYVLARK